jgi:hypothetical protein
VSLATLPSVPGGISGDRWIGVVLDVKDGNALNNKICSSMLSGQPAPS